jgi:sorbose reductase
MLRETELTESQYNASKAALVHLARSLAVEWVDFARVNCISPGFIATDLLATHPEAWRKKWFTMIPAARLCDPYELKGVSHPLNISYILRVQC